MKKKFLLHGWLLMLATVLMVSVSSCENDDPTSTTGSTSGYEGYGYTEITINGKTYKQNDIGGMSSDYAIQSNNFGDRHFGCDADDIAGADFGFILYYHNTKTKFETAQPGNYRIFSDIPYSNGYPDYKNFDLEIYTANTETYKDVISNTKHHTVTKVELLGTNAETGRLIYLVEGNFSCTYTIYKYNNKALDISGKYWTKIEIDPRM